MKPQNSHCFAPTSPQPAAASQRADCPAEAPGLALLGAARLPAPSVWLFCFLILQSVFCLRAEGQNYSIAWYKISGGGGASTGGTYAASGSIGQTDASGTMSGGNFSAIGGFWSIMSVVQTAGLPTLFITNSDNRVIVFWSDPATNRYQLQQNANLANVAGWGTTSYTISPANGTNSITITSPTGRLFFRLTQ